MIRKGILLELKDIDNSKEFKEYMTRLANGTLRFDFKDILNKCQSGYCEDFCTYFYFKYKNINVLEINTQHFIFKYKNMYYDSLTLTGVKRIKHIPYFKNIIISKIRRWDVKELPRYYKKAWKGAINEKTR